MIYYSIISLKKTGLFWPRSALSVTCGDSSGLRHPASASCLGRHSRLAGRSPNSSSLFPPQAAVVAVAPKGRANAYSRFSACSVQPLRHCLRNATSPSRGGLGIRFSFAKSPAAPKPASAAKFSPHQSAAQTASPPGKPLRNFTPAGQMGAKRQHSNATTCQRLPY